MGIRQIESGPETGMGRNLRNNEVEGLNAGKHCHGVRPALRFMARMSTVCGYLTRMSEKILDRNPLAMVHKRIFQPED